ncbi:MAG TPA: hypothetical protein VGR45_06700, partial [Stellaceae bacterium]|nr:hypothetical protein [Stellaceae bacterium]
MAGRHPLRERQTEIGARLAPVPTRDANRTRRVQHLECAGMKPKTGFFLRRAYKRRLPKAQPSEAQR